MQITPSRRDFAMKLEATDEESKIDYTPVR